MAKMFVGVLTIALAVTGLACGSDRGRSGPTSPSSTVREDPPPPPPAPPGQGIEGELWTLTTTIVSLEGSACFWLQPVGAQTAGRHLSVERSDAQVRFVYDVRNPHDNLSFVGAVNQQSFAAATDAYPTGFPCANSVTLSSSVVGNFSFDGRQLSGRERLIYRVAGGGDLIVTIDWDATRP